MRKTSALYRKILNKPVIRRVRKSPAIDEACKRFMESAFVPSRYVFLSLPSFFKKHKLMSSSKKKTSNTKKVVKKKINGVEQHEVVHWKTDTIKQLYQRCILQSPIVAGCKIKYFAKFIPWYVRNKPKYSGLCWKHDVGLFFGKLLKTKRLRWHQDCECECTFCAECAHGKNPDGEGDCHFATCTRCSGSECPIEYDEEVQGKLDLNQNGIFFFK